MLIVLPVSRADHEMAVLLAERIRELGGVKPFPMLVVYAKSCPQNSRKLIESRLSKAAGTLHVFEAPTVNESGWPVSANAIFHDAARHIFKQKGFGEPCWYFMEADNTPMDPNWASALAAEYELVKFPYMGVRHNTNRYQSDGTWKVDGQHMVGTGIYPADFYQSCRLAKHILKGPSPFDVFMQWEIVPQMHHTNLIQHNWSSQNYRRVRGGGIVCESVPERRGISDPIRDGVMVVHGCKDGSLMRLLGDK